MGLILPAQCWGRRGWRPRAAEHATDRRQNAAVADTLGVLLLAMGDSARPVELLVRAHAGRPNDPGVACRLAAALLGRLSA